MRIGMGKGGPQMTGPAADRPTAICVREVPPELFNESSMRSHFSKFGRVVEYWQAEQKKTIFVTFSKHNAAVAALNAPDAVCGNRFITVDWARKQDKPEVEEEEEPEVAQPAYKSKVVVALEEKQARAAEKKSLIAKQIEHQKALVAQMEAMKTLTAQERLEMIRSLTKTMDDNKDQLDRSKPAPAPPTEKAAEAAEGEETGPAAANGEKEELEELEAEFKQLQEKVTQAGIAVSDTPPAKAGKGGKGGGRKSWAKIDLRPKALLLKGTGEDVTSEALRAHFGGAVDDVTVGDEVVVSFKSRKAAETAMRTAGNFQGSQLEMSWYVTPAVVVDQPVGSSAEE